MSAFAELIRVLDTLLGPNGCPWDREQTMKSLRETLLEESCEVIEAIDLGDKTHIQEELGDLVLNAVFLCKLAEKEGVCSFDSVFVELTNKLVRRHPHIFGDASVSTSEGVKEQWERIKKTEKGKEARQHIFDGIPKGLPALAQAQKMLKAMKKNKLPLSDFEKELPEGDQEMALGKALLQIVAKAAHQGIDAEQALRSILVRSKKKARTA